MSSRFARLVNAQYEKEKDQSKVQSETQHLEDTSQPPQSSQVYESSQPLKSSQSPESSQLLALPHGGRESSQLPESSQVPESSQPPQDRHISVNLLASLPEVVGHLELPHQLVDHLFRLLDPFEQAVYLQLYRLSWGFNKPICSISNPKLAERTGMSESTVKKTLGKLRAKGLIEKLGMELGYGKKQGIDFRVSAPSSQPRRSSQSPQSRQLPQAHNKRNTLKENTQTQEQPPPPASVSVGSKFSPEECQRYARHLQSTGQGIKNPGGYATTIYRTGEADASIAAFLSPVTATTAVDASQCTDCQGSGFWYPNGTSGGVAKCNHPKLREGK
jgi:DNA-binding Lrp family transcriptional regulator